jgi:predicted polyphosphate/ATP-dependent NAD kinase
MKRRSLLPQAGLNDTLNESMAIDDVDEEAERRGRVKVQRRQSLAHIRQGEEDICVVIL